MFVKLLMALSFALLIFSSTAHSAIQCEYLWKLGADHFAAKQTANAFMSAGKVVIDLLQKDQSAEQVENAKRPWRMRLALSASKRISAFESMFDNNSSVFKNLLEIIGINVAQANPSQFLTNSDLIVALVKYTNSHAEYLRNGKGHAGTWRDNTYLHVLLTEFAKRRLTRAQIEEAGEAQAFNALLASSYFHEKHHKYESPETYAISAFDKLAYLDASRNTDITLLRPILDSILKYSAADYASYKDLVYRFGQHMIANASYGDFKLVQLAMDTSISLTLYANPNAPFEKAGYDALFVGLERQIEFMKTEENLRDYPRGVENLELLRTKLEALQLLEQQYPRPRPVDSSKAL